MEERLSAQIVVDQCRRSTNGQQPKPYEEKVGGVVKVDSDVLRALHAEALEVMTILADSRVCLRPGVFTLA